MAAESEPVKQEDELEMEAWSWSRSDEMKEIIHTMISHHPPSMYSHCLRLSIRGRSLYFCSRCSGIYGGLGIGIIAIVLLGIQLQPSWLWFMVALALGFATVTDWMTQRLAPRKTRNLVRVFSGLLSGLGLAIVFLLADLLYMLLTLGVMVGSVGIVGLLENRLKAASFDAQEVDSVEEEDETWE